ncbi:hypothetical protein [Paraburkholderia sp. J41]|uniref:hypothetical protein n=1 Tax=Paraburkholderia sp. J41 TaxID=2805433 RepID=UPI002AC35395|nr:hypothetical protein [Paraburkholderia sp. J41]
MAIHTRSREAEAAQRFFEASRNVDRAFRALRGDAGAGSGSSAISAASTHGAAQSRLDRALDELARAQAWFDSVTFGDRAVACLKSRWGADHKDH